jgi:hypothetical protein
MSKLRTIPDVEYCRAESVVSEAILAWTRSVTICDTVLWSDVHAVSKLPFASRGQGLETPKERPNNRRTS